VEGQNKPRDYDLTSARQNYQRFHTPVIVELGDRLELAEHNQGLALRPFVCQLLKEFYAKNEVWHQALQIVAELDCLCALAKVAKLSPSEMTRPVVETRDSRFLYSEGLVHPVLSTRIPGFIANDLAFDSDNYCKVLTGPNMGGKSTILRQLCQSVILAQVGCYVPARLFQFAPVDQIFTRLGGL
jgi:DNA mismatch repair protein MSH6